MKNRYGVLASAAALALLLATAASPQGGNPGQGNAQGNAGRGGGQNQNQNNAPAQPAGALTGQVVSATTGETLRKVTLSLTPQGRGGGPATATSDNAGNFRFASVAPGTYTLSGQRTGFVRSTYENNGVARPIQIDSGQTAGGIQLKLMPQSVVTGKVYDIDGDPVQGAQVTVMRYSYPRGQRQLTNVAQAATNDLGEYRVAALAPGRYYLSASDRGVLAVLQTALTDAAVAGGRGKGAGPGRGVVLDQLRNSAGVDPEAYVTTYYPRTTDASSATPIDLSAGSEMRGIDIGLLKGRNYAISGMVENLPSAPLPQPQQDQAKGKGRGKQFGGPGGGIIVNLVPRTAGPQAGIGPLLAGGIAQVEADGSFVLRNVRPGAYYLRAESRGPQPANRLTARVPVDVSSGDVSGVRVRLSPPLSVSGRIASEKSDSALNLASLRLNFVPSTQGGRGGQQQRIEVAADGRYETTLDPDAYTVELTGAPSGYYLKAVKLAGREAVDNIVDLSINGSALDLVVANDSASITGTVQRSNGDPVQSARVTAVPANNSQRRDLFKAVNSGADGTFTLADLPPGSYKVFAWEEVESNAWMDPDFRRPFDPLGTSATIRDGAGPTLTLRVIGREQIAAMQ